jgi:hypothetical protein
MKSFFEDMTSEQKEKFWDEFKKRVEKDQTFKKRQEDRISKFINKLSQEEIEQWMNKFLKWEDEYEEYRYMKHNEQANSNIFGYLINLLRYKGKEIRIYQDEDFCGGGFKWNKYRFKIYHGQGSFWRIWKGRKQIFQNH